MFESLCFLAGVCIGLYLGLSQEPLKVRYDHWHTRTRLVLIHTTRKAQRKVTVEWDGDAWPGAQDRLVELMSAGRLHLADLMGAEEAMDHLNRKERLNHAERNQG